MAGPGAEKKGSGTRMSVTNEHMNSVRGRVRVGQPSKLFKPPFVGITAFLLVLFVQPLGHTAMIMMEHTFGEQYVYLSAAMMGVIGGAFLLSGMRDTREVPATVFGFFAGTLLWTGWIEFSFVFYADRLAVAPLIENGQIVTKPEYLVMPSSLGVLLATLLYFTFNRETKCNFFRWLQRHCNVGTGAPTRRYKRNFAAITALETIYVIWFFYVVLLLLYDDALFGDRHPVTYIYLFFNTVWALYLFWRLMPISRGASAIRYAVPTAVIAWTSVEILGRWNFFTEIWVHPLDYAFEMSLVLCAFAAFVALASFAPARKRLAEAEDHQQLPGDWPEPVQ
jgi:hypothetical protein